MCIGCIWKCLLPLNVLAGGFLVSQNERRSSYIFHTCRVFHSCGFLSAGPNFVRRKSWTGIGCIESSFLFLLNEFAHVKEDSLHLTKIFDMCHTENIFHQYAFLHAISNLVFRRSSLTMCHIGRWNHSLGFLDAHQSYFYPFPPWHWTSCLELWEDLLRVCSAINCDGEHGYMMKTSQEMGNYHESSDSEWILLTGFFGRRPHELMRFWSVVLICYSLSDRPRLAQKAKFHELEGSQWIDKTRTETVNAMTFRQWKCYCLTIEISPLFLYPCRLMVQPTFNMWKKLSFFFFCPFFFWMMVTRMKLWKDGWVEDWRVSLLRRKDGKERCDHRNEEKGEVFLKQSWRGKEAEQVLKRRKGDR